MLAAHSTDHMFPYPHAARPYLAELKLLEAELDILWPGWRKVPVNRHALAMSVSKGDPNVQRQVLGQLADWKKKGEPFMGYQIERKRRLKWVLKRHDLLMIGRNEGVLVTDSERGDHCYSHPSEQPHDPNDPRIPPPWGLVGSHAPPPRLTPTRVAFDAGVPLEAVEEHLRRCPDDIDPVSWFREGGHRETP